ncbi:MAG: hypothetical protein HZA50_17985 [Planctomycetes bacterium]|nr:hypothetical protein [Planctomycetota bacterium]
MIVLCPKCASRLQVPDAAAGQHTACPACGLVFPITPAQTSRPAVPSQAQPPPVQLPPPGAVFSLPGQKPKGKGTALLITMAIFLLMGAAAMGSSMFLRWWRLSTDCRFADTSSHIRQNQDARQQFEREAQRFREIKDASMPFYRQYLPRSVQDSLAAMQTEITYTRQRNHSIYESFFGDDLGRGIMTFIFACAAVVLVLPQIIFRFCRRWGWPANFIIAGLSLAAFIVNLVFLIRLPSNLLPGYYVFLSQKPFEGVWVAVGASAFTAAWGLATAITGLIIFLRGSRGPAGPAALPQGQNFV